MKMKFIPLILGFFVAPLAAIAIAASAGGRGKSEVNNYEDFIFTFNLDEPYAPAVNAWVREKYDNIDMRGLLQALIAHCNDTEISLEERDASCRAIAVAEQMSMYLSSNEIDEYLKRANDECTDGNTQSCSAIVYSFILSSPPSERYAEYIQSLHAGGQYCHLELKEALDAADWSDLYEGLCRDPSRTAPNENIIGYQSLLEDIASH